MDGLNSKRKQVNEMSGIDEKEKDVYILVYVYIEYWSRNQGTRHKRIEIFNSYDRFKERERVLRKDSSDDDDWNLQDVQKFKGKRLGD